MIAELRMRLSAIRLENFRSYKDRVAIENMTDISILIGRNNAGKSNLIKALHWYQRMALGQEDTSPRLLHTGNKGKPLVFEIEFALEPEERESIFQLLPFPSDEIAKAMRSSQLFRRLNHRLRFNADGLLIDEVVSTTNYSGSGFSLWGFRSERNRVQFWQKDLQGEARENRPPQDLRDRLNESGNRVDRRRGFAWDSSLLPPLSAADRIIREYLQRMLWISPIRQATPRIKPGQDVNISPTGDNLLRVLNTIQGEDHDRYEALMKEIYDIIPDLEEIRTPLRGGEVAGVISEPGDVEIEIDEAGSGLQQTLILVINLLLRPANSLLLVEEPEINLNASAQRALFRLMKRLLDNGHQFIITTHSTIFTETSDKVTTFLLDKKVGVSSIRRLSEPAELRILKQALGHENTDLFGFNAVLIIEGDTEEKCLPLLAACKF